MRSARSKLDEALGGPKPLLSNPSMLISFADLMTILTVFFVMLLSMSDIRKGSFDTLRSQFSGKSEGTLVELAQSLNALVQKNSGVSVYIADDGVRLDLDSAALFDSGEAILKDNSLGKIDGVLRKILSTSYKIDIEGHTDDRGLYRRDGLEIVTNWSLSGRRASSVALYLMQFGFDEKRLRIVGYASNRPKVSVDKAIREQIDEARAMNRRVTLLVR